MLDRSFTSPVRTSGRSKSRFSAERKEAEADVRSPKAQPLSGYRIASVSVMHPDDPASFAGVPDTFAKRFRASQPFYRGALAVLTRGAIVQALSPDMDGYPKGGPLVRTAVSGLTVDELPEHLRSRIPFVPDGLDPFAPLTDDEAEAFMGSALYRVRSGFPRVRFVSGDDLNALKDAYAAEQAELVARSAERERIKQARAERDAKNR